MRNSQYLSKKVEEKKQIQEKINNLIEKQLSIYFDMSEWLNTFLLGNILTMGEIDSAEFKVVPHGENPTDLYFRLDSQIKNSLIRGLDVDAEDDLLKRVRDKLQGELQEYLEFVDVDMEDLEFFVSLPEAAELEVEEEEFREG